MGEFPGDTLTNAELADLLDAIDRDMRSRNTYWRMSIPVQSHDYDIVLSNAAKRLRLALPRPWSTAAELEALPVGSVVRDRVGNVAVRTEHYDDAVHMWWPAGLEHEISPARVAEFAPGLILYVPADA